MQFKSFSLCLIRMNDKGANDLLRRLKEGDEAAFSIIYDYYWDKLYFVSYQKLESANAAEEIVQEVFLTLWEKRKQLKIDSLSTYLAAMARYSVYRYLAREKARQSREVSFASKQGISRSLSDTVSDKFILEKILELSNQLPERCRLVFQYNKIEDLSIKEVSEHLNISPKTAEAHLTKALKFIRLNLRGFINFFL